MDAANSLFISHATSNSTDLATMHHSPIIDNIAPPPSFLSSLAPTPIEVPVPAVEAPPSFTSNNLPIPVDPPSLSTSLQARRGRDGFWKLTGDRASSSSVVSKDDSLSISKQSIPLEDVEMAEPQPGAIDTTLETPTAVAGGSGISLKLRRPAEGLATGDESRTGSPVPTHSASKRKRKADAAASSRSSRPKHSPPSSLAMPHGGHSDPYEASPAPSHQQASDTSANPKSGGALSIFSAPNASEPIPDALSSIISKTAILSSRLRTRDRDGDAMIRDAAEGLESSRTLRPSRGRDGGVRTGVSASGKGVKVGGTPRSSNTAGASGSKKKGKGRGDNDVPNQDFCSACRGIGRFLCCDGCPRSFHFMCLEPPFRIDELPDEERWFCKKCKTDRASAPPGTPVKELKPIPMVFSQLSQKIDQENPLQFRLPQEIRQFFNGVVTGPKGDYVDAEETRTKYDRKGFQEERDGTRLKDGKARPVACYVCGGTSIPSHALTTEPEAAWRQIVSCDYCSLHWHLDCLDPPMASMPNSGRRWMCPNHAEQVMPRRRTVRNNLETVDVEERGQRNNGNIIILADEPAPTIQYEDMVINNRKYRVPEKIIRLDFWEKLGLGKGKVVPPARSERFSFDKKSGNGSALASSAGDFEPTQEEMDAANLILSLLYPANATKIAVADSSELINLAAGSDTQAPRKIVLRVPKSNGESDVLMNGVH